MKTEYFSWLCTLRPEIYIRNFLKFYFEPPKEVKESGWIKMKNWKEDLLNKTDYDWTDKVFEEWKKSSRKDIKHYANGRKDHNRSVKSISNIMYAHRMDKLKKQKLHPIEQSRISNILWKAHLKRCNVTKTGA